ncbi:MAG: maleylpyruvate isomerase family mycothiol-dependent enzyme [Candidatus Dormiibacterota bacterium]
MPTDPGPWVTALRHSHDHLAGRAETLDSNSLLMNSYCPGWNIAHVYSHLGSQAEMFNLFVDAWETGGDPPGQEGFPPIWDAWNGRSPQAQAQDSVTWNERFVSRIEALDADQRREFRVTAFGMDLDLAGLLQLKLAEHAIHSWDIDVSFDPTALVSEESVALLVDNLPAVVARVGKPSGAETTLHVLTSDPERQFALAADGVRLEPWADQATTGTLQLPGEALLRLVYGRLDPAHTPPLELASSGTTLEDLRSLFPGV